MSSNRLGEHFDHPATEPAVPALPSGFAFCPAASSLTANQFAAASFIHQAAYQQAMQEARDRAWRAFLDRALFSVWN